MDIAGDFDIPSRPGGQRGELSTGFSGELVDCVIRRSGSGESDGLRVSQCRVLLRGGTIRKNYGRGVSAFNGAKITVAAEETDKPQTVSKDITESFGGRLVRGRRGNEIIGIPQEKVATAWAAADEDSDEDSF